MRIGVFFGGQSREREISFAGGRTVYDNLNKTLFEPIPVFVDSLGNFILLEWQHIYKGTIRDFYPPTSTLPNSPSGFQVYIESFDNLNPDMLNVLISKVGKKINPDEFSQLFDFAFLALHGPYGEDGNIQGLLEWYTIPYSGSGILPSAIGINKAIQKDLMKNAGFKGPQSLKLSKKEWKETKDSVSIYDRFAKHLGLPFVLKAPYQGSSIGISVITPEKKGQFKKLVNRSFFIQEITHEEWVERTPEKQVLFLKMLIDIREGIGMPVIVNDSFPIHHPEALLKFIRKHFETSRETVILESLDNEEEIIIESFIKGREFSCIVIQDENGNPLALPPTEIVKGNDVFDYRSKYLPGMSRKITPINLPQEEIENIRKVCEKLFQELHFNVYARLDGFYTEKGEIFLNDPNTTSGMLPSSFFFHQAAEIGLNPSQFLTYIIRTSLAERIKTGKKTFHLKQLLSELDEQVEKLNRQENQKIRVAVIMGGFSSERHISVESGRNIYEKLSSSSKYEPFPVFLTGSETEHELYLIPVNIMLKDNADDIHDKVKSPEGKHPIIQEIANQASFIRDKYVSNIITESKRISYEELSRLADEVFIALHGRPGEDGAVQTELEKFHLPYNGSGIGSSKTTINKYETNKILREHGLKVANHRLILKKEWQKDPEGLLSEIENNFSYPLIAKPSDDGCSSAVKKIRSTEEMKAYIRLFFGEESIHNTESARILNIKYNEEFPQKDYFLIEDLIDKGSAKKFLEITGGMLTAYGANGEIQYEVFEPSEALASGDVLSLEEKFLAGEGQNVTPSRFADNPDDYAAIARQVKVDLEKAARALNVQGYCRIDAFVRIFENNRAETIIIEINSLPGMTPATCIFHQTAINGYKPYDFIDKILDFGLKRENPKVNAHNVL